MALERQLAKLERGPVAGARCDPEEDDGDTTAPGSDEEGLGSLGDDGSSSECGPQSHADLDDSVIWVACINITHIATTLPLLVQRGLTFFQEHSLPDCSHPAFVRLASGAKRRLLLGPCDPESKRPSAGVGAIHPLSLQLCTTRPITARFAKAVRLGRVRRFALPTGFKGVVVFYVIYGWTGGHTCARAARRTNKLIDAVCPEAVAQRDLCTFICGDLNADPADIPTIQWLLVQQHWCDVGAQAQLWGEAAGGPTCVAPNASTGTRRDFVFANPAAASAVCGFRLSEEQSFPTHRPLRIGTRLDQARPTSFFPSRPRDPLERRDASLSQVDWEDLVSGHLQSALANADPSRQDHAPQAGRCAGGRGH